MKRILACLIAAACLLTAFALAEGPTMTMKVIKCKQAVNLRRSPSTDSDSLGLVPLGTELTGCSAVEGSDWIMVTYQDITGYAGTLVSPARTAGTPPRPLRPPVSRYRPGDSG